MDDLFRKAAENYPLKPEGADWNKVLGLLQADKGVSKGDKKKLYLWLLLLVLPLSFLFHNITREGKKAANNQMVHNRYTGSKEEYKGNGENDMDAGNGNKIGKAYPVDRQTPSSGTGARDLEPKKGTQPATSSGRLSPEKGTGKTYGSNLKNLEGKSKAVNNKPVYGTPAGNGYANNKAARNHTYNNHAFNKTASNQTGEISGEEQPALRTGIRNSVAGEKYNRAVNRAGSTGYKGVKENKRRIKESGVSSEAVRNNKETGEAGGISKANPVPRSPVEKNALSGVVAFDLLKNKKPAKRNDQLADSTVKARVQDPAVDAIRIKQKKFYAGVLAGPDVSIVKNKKIQGVGYSFGLVAGFQYNKRLSVEAGVLWDQKTYYSEGRYFNTGKMKLPPHTTIIDGHGTCHMIEIPLSVRYAFAYPTRRSNWSVAAGTSSYLMKKEDYDYWYKRYNTEYYVNKVYRNASKNWFSIIHISTAYQKKIKHIGDVRIEPYLKFPIKGVGIGSLPISSGGINFVITRPVR